MFPSFHFLYCCYINWQIFLLMSTILQKSGSPGWFLHQDWRKAVNMLGSAVSNHKMAALPHSLPTHGIMVTLIIPFYSLSIQPIYWDQTKSERKAIALFHPRPCLINLSALAKQANGSVGGSTGNKTINFFWWRRLVVICFQPAAQSLMHFVAKPKHSQLFEKILFTPFLSQNLHCSS